MCGRFTQHLSWQEIVELYGLIGVAALNVPANYNVAPTHDVLTLRLEDGVLTPQMMRWGLVPSWAKDIKIGYKLINARGETAAEKPSFRAAFKQRRCVIPADGFYEWKRAGKEKQPYYVRRADGLPMSFAGLWERWDKSGEPIVSFTIVTTEASEAIRSIHHRMPVIVDDPKIWLAGGSAAIRPYDGRLEAHPVDPAVGNVRNNEARLMAPVEPEAADGADGQLDLLGPA